MSTSPLTMEDLPWLPSSSKIVNRSGGYLSVIVNSEEELTTLLDNHKRATLTSFNKWSVKFKDAGKLRLLWQVEDYSEDTPLCVTKRVIRDCKHGKASRTPTAKQEHSLEHMYTKKQCRIWKGKKVDCPAKLFIRHVKRYDTFSVKGEATRTRKEDAMKRLKQELAQANPPTSTFIHVKLPLVEAHQNHSIDIGCCFGRQINPKVKDKSVDDGGAGSGEDGGALHINMSHRLKSAQLKFREELKMLSDDSYLCEDEETLRRSTEVLINLRKSFLPSCRQENGLMLNKEKETVMFKQDSEVLRSLPLHKRRAQGAKKKKTGPGTPSIPLGI